MKNIILYLLFLAFVCNVNAQTETSRFKNGDVFEKQIFLKSAATLYNGNRQLTTNSSSVVYRLYKVTGASDSANSFLVITKKIVDTVNVDGTQAFYDSEKKQDTSSGIQKELAYVIGKTTSVSVKANGVISAVQYSSALNNADSFYAYAELMPDKIVAGNKLELVTVFPVEPLPGKGYSWTDSLTTLVGNEIVTYTIDKVTAKTTIINFTGYATKKYDGIVDRRNMNTNIKGRMVVDNATGLIMEKLVKTTSSGYNLKSGKTLSLSKTTTCIERVLKAG